MNVKTSYDDDAMAGIELDHLSPIIAREISRCSTTDSGHDAMPILTCAERSCVSYKPLR